MREKYTTTLTSEHKRKLKVLASNKGLNGNDLIEQLIDIEWGKYINEMGTERDKSRETTKHSK